ncbi:hypothetical protein HOY80DRAFT_977093 [Tuber brumale]|nr:hypothetical protein HOY80DRAFT_977093 [Tuber brumale]
MGMETGSLSDITASKIEAPTSPSSGIDMEIQEEQEEQESELPEPTVPTTPLVPSTIIKNPLKYRVGRKDLRWLYEKPKKQEERKSPMGSPSGEELKWATGSGPGSTISGTLSSLVVPPKKPATNIWHDTDVPLPPDFLDQQDDFTDIFGPIPIGSKPFVFPDSPPANHQAMDPIPMTPKAAFAPAPRERVSIRPPVGAVHEKFKRSENMPDYLNTAYDPKYPNLPTPAPGMSPINQKPAPVEQKVQLSEFEWTGENTKKLEDALTTLAALAESEKKTKRTAVVAGLYPAPGKDLEEQIRKGEKRLEEQWELEERAEKERAARGKLMKKGIARPIKPLRAKRT